MREITLGELLDETGGSIKTGPFGTVLKAAEYSRSGAPVISVGEVGHGHLRIHERTPRVPDDVVERLPEYRLRSGDIVFGRKGAVDRSAWLRAHEDGYFLGSDGIRVRVGNGADSRFVAYQLQSSRLRDWLIQHSAGTTMASLNQPTLERVPLRIPELVEQRGIAEVLGALDDKIAANAALVRTCDELAAALTRSSLSAEESRLGDIADVVMGSSPPGTSYNESGAGAPFNQGVRDFGVRNPANRVWTIAPVRMAATADTLVSVRAPVGRTNLAAEATCIGRGLAAVRARDGRAMTLFHVLRDQPDVWAPFESEGTIFGSINKQQLAGVRVGVVLADRAHWLEKQLEAIEARISSALRESDQLACTRDVLLPLLMSGKIRVNDAERIVAGETEGVV